MSLQQASFDTLRRRFEAAADKHGALHCVMVDRPSGLTEYHDFPNQKPSSLARLALSGGSSLYAQPTMAGDEIRPGRLRDWETYGTSAGWHTFAKLAADAGRLLISQRVLSCDCLAAQTANVDDAAERWLWALFDLAWSPAAGSPLQATRWAWWKNVRMPLDQVDEQRRVWGAKLETPIGRALAFIPDPPDSFYSVLQDLFSASVYAIDRLEQHTAESRDDATDDDLRPGQWFTLHTKIPTARLRQAANPTRKTKRVRKKTIDGVECYSVSDARRWWPGDMKKA